MTRKVRGVLKILETEGQAPVFRALVVDDEEAIVDLVCCMLTKLGIEAQPSLGSLQARHCLEARHYDLMLTDLQMPGMNGFELASWARSRLRVDKVVIMTGCAEVKDYRDLSPNPVDYWLSKPFSFPEFRTIIRSMQDARPSIARSGA